MIITLYQYNSYYLRVPEEPNGKPTAHLLEPLRQLIRDAKTISGTLLALKQAHCDS